MRKNLFLLPMVVALLSAFAVLPVVAQESALTPANPIKVDLKDRTVSILAEVNGKYLVQPTRHAVVFKGGKFGDKSVFSGLVDPKSFHEALMSAGFKPGNNMTMENKEKTHVQGDRLDVSVTWKGAGKAYNLDEVIKDSNGKPIEVRFGGNLPNSMEKNTGCILCLDSCPVGITSNATYTYGAVESRKEVSFSGNKDILPPDRSLVTITFSVKK